MNRYCERLKIPVPRLQDYVGRPELSLNSLMVLAILEHGEPATLEAIVERLERAGVGPGYRGTRSPDLASALKKAWHGLPPVYRDAGGRYGLDLGSEDLEWLLFVVGLRPSTFQKRLEEEGEASLREPPPDPVAPPDSVALSHEELEAAWNGRPTTAWSTLRQAAAVLDAFGRPMSLEEVEQVLASLTNERSVLGPETAWSWRSSLVQVEGLTLRLNPASPDIAAMRRAVRAKAYRVLAERARAAHWKATRAVADRAQERAERQAEIEAGRTRRAIIRVVPEPRRIRAAALVDLQRRDIQTFVGDEVSLLPGLLEHYDLVGGIAVRETLAALGLDADRWRLADLGPPQKTITLTSGGRVLRLTPEMVIRSTVGIATPLGDRAKMREYLAANATGKLRRRLEADVKSLAALYRYAVLHGYVRVRWGFLDETIGVAGWGHPGDLTLYHLFDRVQELDLPVDIVIGDRAPAWDDPWRHAERVHVVSVEYQYAIVEGGRQRIILPYGDIQDVRIAPPDDGGKVTAH